MLFNITFLLYLLLVQCTHATCIFNKLAPQYTKYTETNYGVLKIVLLDDCRIPIEGESSKIKAFDETGTFTFSVREIADGEYWVIPDNYMNNAAIGNVIICESVVCSSSAWLFINMTFPRSDDRDGAECWRERPVLAYLTVAIVVMAIINCANWHRRNVKTM